MCWPASMKAGGRSCAVIKLLTLMQGMEQSSEGMSHLQVPHLSIFVLEKVSSHCCTRASGSKAWPASLFRWSRNMRSIADVENTFCTCSSTPRPRATQRRTRAGHPRRTMWSLYRRCGPLCARCFLAPDDLQLCTLCCLKYECWTVEIRAVVLHARRNARGFPYDYRSEFPWCTL